MKQEYSAVSQLIPLRSIEQSFKSLYGAAHAHPVKNDIFDFEKPIDTALFNELLEHFPKYAHLAANPIDINSQNLLEDSYFQTKLDISAVQHVRYMPAVMHIQEFFELDCVLRGNIKSFVREKEISLDEGDVMIIAPRTSHASCTYSDDCIMVNILVRQSTFEDNFLNLLPDNDIFKDFFSKALYRTSDTPYLIFRTQNPDFLNEHISPILREIERNNRYKNTMMSALLSAFFVELLRGYEKDVQIPYLSTEQMNENVVFILEYLQKNYSTITLSHLAGFFNYSERQMQRILQKTTGMTFSEAIKKLRMSHAEALLKESDMTIAEIADQLGYYDSSSFRQVFKKEFGMSPQSYRELISG